jgi:hypothetical protein
MRTVWIAFAALAIALGTAAHAQLPFPFPVEPDPGKRAQCTRDYVRSVEDRVAMLEKLRSSGPKAVGHFCSLIEMGKAWLGNSGEADGGLLSWLGLDNVDLDRMAAQCRAGQDGLARELKTELARLRMELLRCDDTV